MSDSGMHEKKKLRQPKEIDRSLSPEPSGKMDILMKRSALPQSDRSTSPPGVASDEEPRKKDKKKSEKEHKEKKRKAKKSTESSEVFFSLHVHVILHISYLIVPIRHFKKKYPTS